MYACIIFLQHTLMQNTQHYGLGIAITHRCEANLQIFNINCIITVLTFVSVDLGLRLPGSQCCPFWHLGLDYSCYPCLTTFSLLLGLLQSRGVAVGRDRESPTHNQENPEELDMDCCVSWDNKSLLGGTETCGRLSSPTESVC